MPPHPTHRPHSAGHRQLLGCVRMDALTGFLITSLFCASRGLHDISATLGDDVVLPCRGPITDGIQLLKWTRPDLKSEGYVFFCRNNRSYENYQHTLFRGRVELRDPRMADGDAAVVLRDVGLRDAGTYECYVSGRRKRAHSENSRSIHLTVTAPGDSQNQDTQGQNEDEDVQIEGDQDTASVWTLPDVLLYVGPVLVGVLVLYVAGMIYVVKVKLKGKKAETDESLGLKSGEENCEKIPNGSG